MRLSIRGAFSLLEIGVLLVIFGGIAAMVTILGGEWVASERDNSTELNLRTIEEAMDAYRKINGRLPCPADITMTDDDAEYGFEAYEAGDTLGVCQGEAGINAAAAGTGVAYGAVPAETLEISPALMRDQWGNLIVYYVTERATQEGSFWDVPKHTNYIEMTDTSAGQITVQDGRGGDRTTTALYALVSHGPNEHGAYDRGGVQQPTTDASTEEVENVDSTPNAILVAKTLAEDFDDIISYKERRQLFNNVPKSAAACSMVSGEATEVFSSAGTHNYTVPAGVEEIHFQVWGAGGGSGNGGAGGYVEGTMTVSTGQAFTIHVAAAGGNNAIYSGGGGGGASAVVDDDTTNPVLIAGGGGGGGYAQGGVGGNPGAAGANESSSTGGGGATQSAHGGAGSGCGGAGESGQTTRGGRGRSNAGGPYGTGAAAGAGYIAGGRGGAYVGGAGGASGGGGGGFYSGGSGGSGCTAATGGGAGGGGSSWAAPSLQDIVYLSGSGTTAPNQADPNYVGSAGGATRPGLVVINGTSNSMVCHNAVVISDSCKAILDAGNSTGDGFYEIDPDGDGGDPAFNVYCDMTTDGGGWTVVVGEDQEPYRSGTFPFSPSLTGVGQSFSLGQYYAVQGTSASGFCNSPQPSLNVVIKGTHQEIKYHTWQRWHNATGTTHSIDFENDGSLEAGSHTCGSACGGPGSVWNFTLNTTTTHTVPVTESRVAFIGRSCQNMNPNRGMLHVYYLAYR